MLGLLLSLLELFQSLLLVPLYILHAISHLLSDDYFDEEVGLSRVDGVILFGNLE